MNEKKNEILILFKSYPELIRMTYIVSNLYSYYVFWDVNEL